MSLLKQLCNLAVLLFVLSSILFLKLLKIAREALAVAFAAAAKVLSSAATELQNGRCLVSVYSIHQFKTLYIPDT